MNPVPRMLTILVRQMDQPRENLPGDFLFAGSKTTKYFFGSLGNGTGQLANFLVRRMCKRAIALATPQFGKRKFQKRQAAWFGTSVI